MKLAKSDQNRQQLIDYFADHAPHGLDEADKVQIRALLPLYYQHLSVPDLEDETQVDLMGGLIAHWQLAKTRQPGVPSVRVYNPNFEEHGWQSRSTIVEVVSRDMAFLVDSISMVLNGANLTIFLTIHPIVHCVRDAHGKLLELLPPGAGKGADESMIRLHVDKQVGSDVLQRLEAMVRRIIQDVELANHDWDAMKDRVHALRLSLEECRPPVAVEELSESLAFLEWIENGHFTFLATCACNVQSGPDGDALAISKDSTLGLFRRPVDGAKWARSVIPAFDRPLAPFDSLLLITKANARSTVHRPAYMDFLGIKRFDKQGALVGLDCFLGLFTSSVYNCTPAQIPFLRKKVEAVLANAGAQPLSHSGRRLRNVLDSFPRDDLFQISTIDLMQMSTAVVGLQERQRTRLFVRRDSFNRFYSCLLYVPRDRYNRELRLAVQDLLVEAFHGTELEFNAQFSESILARLHYIVHSPADAAVEFDTAELEARIVDATLTWQDGFKDALIDKYDEVRAFNYFNEYRNAFPNGFQEDFYPRTAVADIDHIEQARSSGGLAIHVYRPILEAQEKLHIRLYSVGEPILLSKAIPILENFGLTVFGERPYRIKHADGAIWIHDFATAYARPGRDIDDATARLVQEAVLHVWSGDVDNDGFNQLVLAAGFAWRQVVAVRAYGRYLQQIRTPFSQAYIIESLVRYPDIAQLLLRLFDTRFDPKREGSAGTEIEETNQLIEGGLEKVESLDQDRILRSFQNLIQATLRTNFFQRDQHGAHKPYVSYKIDPTQVARMPLPRPMFEIFVFSTRMEGVHLRGGRWRAVACVGPIAWKIIRTEVLGLMKAQMVKNAVIVPVGSKGGFVASGCRRVAAKRSWRRSSPATRLPAGHAGYYRQPGRRRAWHRRGCVPRRRRPLSGGRSRQGHGDLLRYRQRVSEEYGSGSGDAFASGGSAATTTRRWESPPVVPGSR